VFSPEKETIIKVKLINLTDIFIPVLI